MKNVLGVVFSNMHEHVMGELSANRCMGSIPVGGRYRLIDFALSSFTNSGVEEVGVITKSNYQSLIDHLGSGREWDLSRKNGGLVILPPFGRAESGMYRGRVDALAGIMGFMNASGKEHVITCDSNMMANIDYQAFVDYHRERDADITLMYKRMEVLPEDGRDRCVLELRDNGDVAGLRINPHLEGHQNVMLNVMVAKRDFLQRVVEDCYSRSLYSFEKDVIQASLGRARICSWEFDGYVSRFDSLHTYFKANMELLRSEVREALFPRNRPVYTKVRDEAPVRYGLDANVSHSLIADGCLIEGQVENSVLFRGVKVGRGAKVRNCIVMQGGTVGDGCSLEYVVTDKNVVIKDNRMLMGYETYPVYIAKGSLV